MSIFTREQTTNGYASIEYRCNRTSFRQLSHIVALGLMLLLSPYACHASGSYFTASEYNLLERQREDYLNAKGALEKDNLVSFRQYRDRLNNYPLAAYLDFYEINRHLDRRSHHEIKAFLQKNKGDYLADKLLYLWLGELSDQSRWEDFIHYYDDSIAGTTMRCIHLHARLNTGDPTVYKDIETIWNVGKSQPNECNPAFTLWKNKGHLSSSIAWERFSKAISTREKRLAKYLLRYMNPEDQQLATLMLALDNNPQLLKKQGDFSGQGEKMQAIILHGIKRYARKDSMAALSLWYRYDAQQLFDDQQRQKTQEYIASRLINDQHHREAETLIARIPSLSNEKLIERLIRDALAKLDWKDVQNNIQSLPAQVRASERWRYWLARSQIELSKTPKTPDAIKVLDELAQDRSYFSFLAADAIGKNYRLSDNPANISTQQLEKIATKGSSLRARELFAVNQLYDARREWSYLERELQKDEYMAAAKLAFQWGWHRKTIQSMVTANYWDDLQMRFPLAYNKHVMRAAIKHKVSPMLLFAIARQESAFTPDARSPVGAMGLMQLMPSTAKQTAKAAGMTYHQQALLQPETNIKLGSHYLTGLLNRFDGNRILAAAAYNAGPNRVRQWLNRSDQRLPFDVWIETIPFYETRKYVQNVLAYSVIYGYRMGTTPNLISPTELKKFL